MKKNHIIKILVITPYFYPHTGGSERYMEELYNQVVKQNPRVKVDVLCYNTNNSLRVEKYRNLRIYRVPGIQILRDQFALPNYFSLIRLLRRLTKNKYAFVHTQMRLFDTAWWAWIYAKIIKAKSLLTVHVANHPVHSNRIINQIVKMVDKSVAAWSLKKYDLILASNVAVAKFIKHKLGYDRPMQLVYGGVDTEFYKPRIAKTKIIPGVNKKLSKNSIVITYTGRMLWSKGVTYLYEAIKLLNKKLPRNVYFVFAGPGKLKQELFERSIRDKFTKRIIFTGNLDKSGIRTLLQNTDIYVLPTHHSEGIPNSLLEAGASGCLVITTDNGGNTEVVKNKQTGLIVKAKNAADLAEKIIWVLKNKKQTQKTTGALRKEIVANFVWKNIAVKFNQNVISNYMIS